MDKDKLEFTPKEFRLLSDQEILPLKQAILKKLEVLLDLLHTDLRKEVSPHAGDLPDFLLVNPGKLSRGDNYQAFAYRILDYPAFFQKQDWLFFRTLILWGHPVGFHFMGPPICGSWAPSIGTETCISLLRKTPGNGFPTPTITGS